MREVIMVQCKHGWDADVHGVVCPTCACPPQLRPKGNTQRGRAQLLDWLRAEYKDGRVRTLGEAAQALGVQVRVVRARAEALAREGALWPPRRIGDPLRLTTVARREAAEIVQLREALQVAPVEAQARLLAWMVRDGLLEDQEVATDALCRFLEDEAAARAVAEREGGRVESS